MKKLLIIKTGTTFETIYRKYGDFDDFIIHQSGIPIKDVLTLPVYQNKQLPDLEDISAIIITGSHAMVTDQEAWSQYIANWLQRAELQSIPVLGICYGHQLLATAFGGHVDYHPGGREVGTVTINLTKEGAEDPLLGSLPSHFSGHVTHAQTVRQLPPKARLLAYNDFEQHHAFVIHDSMWGVQFHPEFTEDITRAYIFEQQATLVQEGYDVTKLYHTTKKHPYGQLLLQQFLKLAD